MQPSIMVLPIIALKGVAFTYFGKDRRPQKYIEYQILLTSNTGGFINFDKPLLEVSLTAERVIFQDPNYLHLNSEIEVSKSK